MSLMVRAGGAVDVRAESRSEKAASFPSQD